MKFDRMAPGGGVEVSCRLENGKALLEWEFSFAESVGEQTADYTGESRKCTYIRLILTDMRGEIALEGMRLVREEEPLQSILLQPLLWRGPSEPYLYHAEAVLADREGNCLDRVSRPLALRSLGCMDIQGKRQLLLNGSAFEPRAVSYALPVGGTAVSRQYQMTEELRRMCGMGANSICVEADSQEIPESFRQLCDRLGLLLFFQKEGEEGLVWIQDRECKFRIQCDETIPSFGGGRACLFPNGNGAPASLYYYYRAKWSRELFVYIVPESIKRMDSGNFTVKCYSNCDRVALYSDGNLFEFQRGETEFVFREVPAGKPSVMLTAEGDGCSESLSVHKSFLERKRRGSNGSLTSLF
ncbi:MAG: hypothetical protein HFH89_04275 [Lachnospiraceae bacterium]|nr:hypothetical protein [uncultured Acetatifactor sp.]MCI8286869.1 hypothetical protein [Lachnospiraceae bacterium]